MLVCGIGASIVLITRGSVVLLQEFCTSHDVNPMAIVDSGASHVILPITALHDDKSAKQVNLRLAAGAFAAVEAHREMFAKHVTIPLCPLERVVRKLQLTAIWTRKL